MTANYPIYICWNPAAACEWWLKLHCKLNLILSSILQGVSFAALVCCVKREILFWLQLFYRLTSFVLSSTLSLGHIFNRVSKTDFQRWPVLIMVKWSHWYLFICRRIYMGLKDLRFPMKWLIKGDFFYFCGYHQSVLRCFWCVFMWTLCLHSSS